MNNKNNRKQKRVAAIHDISGFGRCSITVALPIISAAGIECSVVPTAVLSTHTGGLEGFTYRDLTDDILPIATHWQSLGLGFDAIYSGFLGSYKQVEIVSGFIDRFRTADNLVMVDPVMADNGVLYKTFAPDFPQEMLRLCKKADLIVPNMTEAALLLGETYKEGPYTETYISGILKKLASLGSKLIVLTGVCFDDKSIGAAAYDCATGQIDYAMAARIPGFYPGTGDVFGSTLLAGLLNGKGLACATEFAVKYVASSINRTYTAGTDSRFGINFEAGLGAIAANGISISE
ncbi:MAG: pyridoxamine kinase [Defluviitaleaceae bacterium]|nr:pyridoxamine kinase [Defluviitaleaceae bacterium]